MRRNSTGWQLALIVILTLASVYVTLDVPRPEWLKGALFWQPEGHREIALRQGLDLQGGLQVLLAADLPPSQELDPASMETARRIVENRVNSLGLTEPVVQSQGERRIIVELPGIENPEQAVDMIKGTALLEFVDTGRSWLPPGALVTTTLGGPRIAQDAPVVDGAPGAGEAVVLPTATPQIMPSLELSPTASLDEPPPSEPIALETIVTGADLRNVGMDLDQQTGAAVVTFQLNPDAAQVFGAHTASHIGQFLCIVLDKEVISCPEIQSAIPSGEGVIQGNFTFDTAQQLMLQLRYGALPIPLRVESFNRIGATLGAESVEKSVRAGSIGLGIVLVFMLVYYRLPGALADIALIVYVLINFALYKLIPITITLPGIAGFILSAGMAVDANILIFERLKEELRSGRRLASAVEIGFTRAWPSIRDGQLSTLIICAVLFLFGTNFGASIVKGFALTLAIGTVVNVFTAVFATRTFVRLVAASAADWLAERRQLMEVSVMFSIVQRRRWYYAGSGILLALCIVVMIISTALYGQPLRIGNDFTGGSIFVIQFDSPATEDAIRRAFADQGIEGSIVQPRGTPELNTWQIRTREVTADEVSTVLDALRADVAEVNEDALLFDTVAPAVGGEVARAAGLAILVTALIIVGFIWFSFRRVPNAVRYGVCTIVGMLHNLIITFGFYSLMGILAGWEVDALFLTAILTVIGFSVQDVIVVFDRIRENIPKHRREPFETVVNRSILETIHRSLATQLNAMFVMVAVILFGGATIKPFVATMLIGMVSETYSALFIAVPLLVSWEKAVARRAAAKAAA